MPTYVCSLQLMCKNVNTGMLLKFNDLDFVTVGHKWTQAGTKVTSGPGECEQLQRAQASVKNIITSVVKVASRTIKN